jgi:hypothetical protein
MGYMCHAHIQVLYAINKKMKWINSTGGSSIIIASSNVDKWSGVGTINSALIKEFEEAEDFMDPNQCHYGQACEIEDEIGLIKIQDNSIQVIIIGDEPLQMTLIENTEKDCFIIVKWSCGESLQEFESFLDFNKIEPLPDWTELFKTEFRSNKYIIMDSSESGFELEKDELIEFELKEGDYNISSFTYSPNEKTTMYLYKFKIKQSI